MNAGGLVVPVGALLLLPVLMVTVLLGSSSTSAAATSGVGPGLRAGTVPAAYEALVLAAGTQCAAAPAGAIAAQIEQESGWDPNAVSPAGAEGISQFLPSTWPTWSLPGQSPFDPAAAIPAQARYDCAIAAQMAAWQSQGRLPTGPSLTELMLAGYNAGPFAVLAAGGIPNNSETPGYVTAIMARAAFFAAAPAVAGGSFAAREIAAAESQLGVPYSWVGGSYTGPTLGVCGPDGAGNDCRIVGWDCSGLVMYAVFQASGGAIQLPHFADTQTRGGTPVPLNELLPGDLISFTNPGETVAHHIGIYLGNGQMIDAPESGELVRVDSLASAYYRSQQWRAVRYG